MLFVKLAPSNPSSAINVDATLFFIVVATVLQSLCDGDSEDVPDESFWLFSPEFCNGI